MSRWTTQRLGELTEILSGFAFDSERFSESGDLPIVRIRDVVPGRSTTYYHGEYDPKYMLRDGDMLIGMDGEFNRARWWGGKALLNQRVCRISTSSRKLDDAYLFYFLPAALKVIEDATPFVTVKHLSVKTIRDIEIPLPPLEEQLRIAEVLDRADALRAKRRTALAQLDTLTQAIFLDLFGDPVTNKKGFRVSRMGDVCDVRDGTHDSPQYVSEGGYPLVTSKNLSGGKVDLTNVNNISATDFAQINRRSKVDRGDILLPMIGTIGSPVLIDHEPHFAIKNVALIKFASTSPSAVYVRHLLSCHYFDHIIGQMNRGGTQKFVSLGDLRSFPLPLPPPTLQREFAHRVVAAEYLRISHSTSLCQLDALFAALQHRAFRGEL